MRKNHTTYISLCIIGGLIGLSLLLYWKTLSYEFINLDDDLLIVNNNQIRSLTPENIIRIFTPGTAVSYQPIRVLSYAIDYHFWQLNPTGYHLTNLLWHSLNILLVYLIAMQMTTRRLLACCAALLFAVHPIHVEAVAWASGRRDVLSLACTLAAFACFLRLSSSSRGVFYVLTLALFTLSLLTKPSIVIFPVLLIWYDLCFLSPEKRMRRNWRFLPFFLILAGYMQLFLSVARDHAVLKTAYHGGSIYSTVLTMLRIFGEYLVSLLLPRQLCVIYGVTPVNSFFEPSFLLALCVLLLVIAVMIVTWKKARIICFGTGWFFIGLLPMSNIVPFSTLKADRYLYLPSVGYSLIFGWLVVTGWDIFRRRRIASPLKKRLLLASYWVMIGLILVSYMALTIRRRQDWRDSETLWAATLDVYPNHPIALNNLGIIYAQRGKLEQALALFEHITTAAPGYERIDGVFANIGQIYAQQQAYEDAENAYRQALEIQPHSLEALLGLGHLRQSQGRYAQAHRFYTRATETSPRDDRPYYLLGRLFFEQGDYEKAAQQARQAITRNILSYEAYELLGDACFQREDKACAREAYQKAHALRPEHSGLQQKLKQLQ